MNDQKLENLLNLALDATSEELERSERLSEGYDRADNTWDLIIKYNGDLTELEREGAVFTPLVNEYAIVTISQELIPWLASQVQVEYIEKPKRLSFTVNQGRAASCINGLSRAPLGLSGKGVLLAIIDSGIDYTHPDFRNADGSTRLLALWVRRQKERRQKGYRIGSEFTQEELNQSLRENQVLSRDLSGHGTRSRGDCGRKWKGFQWKISGRGAGERASGSETGDSQTGFFSEDNRTDAGRGLCGPESSGAIHAAGDQFKLWEWIWVP